MTNQEIICWFMWAKHYRLVELGSPYLYFSLEDQEDILKLSDEKAENFVYHLIHLLDNKYVTYRGFPSFYLVEDPAVCPYCYLTKQQCKKCSWKKKHGICSSSKGHYQATLAYFSAYTIVELLGEQYMVWAIKHVAKFYAHKDKWEYIR